MESRLKHLFTNDYPSLVLLLMGTLYLFPINTYAGEVVGAITAVQKDVHVVHPGNNERLLVHQGDDVMFSDVYETGAGAKVKILFKPKISD